MQRQRAPFPKARRTQFSTLLCPTPHSTLDDHNPKPAHGPNCAKNDHRSMEYIHNEAQTMSPMNIQGKNMSRDTHTQRHSRDCNTRRHTKRRTTCKNLPTSTPELNADFPTTRTPKHSRRTQGKARSPSTATARRHATDVRQSSSPK